VFARFLLATLVAAGGGLHARAADLSAIKRDILREPDYKAAPRYCLLVFGTDATTRIWMVLDGNTLYVDRNGNGDLTEAGEKVTGQNYFMVDRIVERDGTVYKDLRVNAFADGTFALWIGHGQRVQYVGVGRMDRPAWGDKRRSAPIIHLNGPMTLERYGPIYTVPRAVNLHSRQRRFSLRLLLGTPGLGKGTFASYDEVCSENLGPIRADIEYPSRDPLAAPLKQRLELIHDG
jgi:hypothetical protein